jgi:general secretion pathway protein A
MVQLRSPELSALKQRIAIYSHLRVLTLAELRSYVAERLHVAGLGGESPFAAAAIEEIYRFSGGVPRVANLLCDRSLTSGFRQEMKKIGTNCVVEAAEELGLTPVAMDGMNGRAVDFSTATRV